MFFMESLMKLRKCVGRCEGLFAIQSGVVVLIVVVVIH